MGYKKAKDILPQSLLENIQDYIDGEYIYIPRKDVNRKSWGEVTKSKEIVKQRNQEISQKNKAGLSLESLAEEYFLSYKSIQRIVSNT